MSITVKAIFRGRKTKGREFDEMKISGCHDNDNMEQRNCKKKRWITVEEVEKVFTARKGKEGEKEEDEKMRTRSGTKIESRGK